MNRVRRRLLSDPSCYLRSPISDHEHIAHHELAKEIAEHQGVYLQWTVTSTSDQRTLELAEAQPSQYRRELPFVPPVLNTFQEGIEWIALWCSNPTKPQELLATPIRLLLVAYHPMLLGHLTRQSFRGRG